MAIGLLVKINQVLHGCLKAEVWAVFGLSAAMLFIYIYWRRSLVYSYFCFPTILNNIQTLIFKFGKKAKTSQYGLYMLGSSCVIMRSLKCYKTEICLVNL